MAKSINLAFCAAGVAIPVEEPTGDQLTQNIAQKSSNAAENGQLSVVGWRPLRPSCWRRVRLKLDSLYYDGVKEPETTPSLNDSTLGWALCFEVGLGLLALLCGHLTNVWPADRLWPISLGAIVLGILSAIPPLLIMLSLRRVEWRVFRELTDFVDEKLTPMFRGLNIGELAMLSLAAGWGEELLFRGLLQAEFAQGSNIITGILIASFVFALVHFLTPAYFAMAFLISIYFGWLFYQFDSLWVPILSHATYDFLMLLYIRQIDLGKTAEANEPPATQDAQKPDAQKPDAQKPDEQTPDEKVE